MTIDLVLFYQLLVCEMTKLERREKVDTIVPPYAYLLKFSWMLYPAEF
jgi:hypothetical protein